MSSLSEESNITRVGIIWAGLWTSGKREKDITTLANTVTFHPADFASCAQILTTKLAKLDLFGTRSLYCSNLWDFFRNIV